MEDLYDGQYDPTDFDERLRRAAWIALEYGFNVNECLELVDMLMCNRDDKDELSTVLQPDAELGAELASILRDFSPILERLRKFRLDHGIDLETLVLAISNPNLRQLRLILGSLREIALFDRDITPRDPGIVINLDDELLLARVVVAACFWVYEDGIWPSTGFVRDFDPVELEQEELVQFIKEVLLAAGLRYSDRDLRVALQSMQPVVAKHFGLSPIDTTDVRSPTRPKLYLVKPDPDQS